MDDKQRTDPVRDRMSGGEAKGPRVPGAGATPIPAATPAVIGEQLLRPDESTHPEVSSLIEAGLGLGDAVEQLAAHLASCVRCTDEVRDYALAAGQLPLALEPLPLPAGGRNRLLAAIAGTRSAPGVAFDRAPSGSGLGTPSAQSGGAPSGAPRPAAPSSSWGVPAPEPRSTPDNAKTGGVVHPSSPAPTQTAQTSEPPEGADGAASVETRVPADWVDRRALRVVGRNGPRVVRGTGRERLAWAAAAAAVLLALVQGSWNWRLRDDVARLEADRAAAPIVLRRPDTGAIAGQTLVWADGSGTVAVRGLAAPPPGRVYEVWTIREGRPEPAALLDADGTASVAALPAGATIALTEEPAPSGSPAPTGPVLLAGTRGPVPAVR